MPLGVAISSIDARLASCAITTVFHSLHTLAIKYDSSRSAASARRTVEALSKCVAEGLTRVRHRVIVRCELTDEESCQIAAELLRKDIVTGVCIQDHTPSNDEDVARFPQFCLTELGMSPAEASSYLAAKRKRLQFKERNAKTIAQQAHAVGKCILTHDDCDRSDIQKAMGLGATVSEFPATPQVTEIARQQGLYVCFGAPNALRGRSHAGHAAAKHALKPTPMDILCSDYYPPALLPAIWNWGAKKASLPEAVRLSTLNPASAMRLRRIGIIAPGNYADFAIVQERANQELCIEEVYVGGRRVH